MKDFSPIPDQLQFGDIHQFQGLAVMPALLSSRRHTVSYMTLDEAIVADTIRITEIHDAGNVPELLLENRSSLPVLLVDGEELVGAKQNRILNLTVFAPPNRTIVIPVSCVEAGRWNYTSDRFMNSTRAHFARGRARKMASVTDAMQTDGNRRSNQGEVWADIDMKFSRMDMASSTSAMSDLYQEVEQHLVGYTEAFTTRPTQVGAFFYLHGDLVGFDLFDRPKTFASIFPKLIRSYAIDAIEHPDHEQRSPAFDSIVSLVSILRQRSWKSYPGTGLGTDYRLNTPRITAASLVVQDLTIHSSGFLLNNSVDAADLTGRISPMAVRRRMRPHRM